MLNNRCYHIALRELRRIFSLNVHKWALLVLPIVLFILYSSIYHKQYLDDLPVAVWDEDNSGLSRQFAFILEQTKSIHFTKAINDQSELQKIIASGEVFGVVHFPKNMAASIKSNQSVAVSVYTNTAYMVPAKLIYKDAAKAIITASSGAVLTKFIKTGMPKSKAMALVQPVKLNTRTLYNPSYNYRQYLVPGLLTVTIQMILIMVSALVFNYERKTDTFYELFLLSKGSAVRSVLGKLIAHILISWLLFLLMVGVFYPILSLLHEGAVPKLFFIYNILVLACLSIGFTISILAKDITLSLDIALFYTSPAFVFSGYTFPRWAMPWYDWFYANLMPYTHFLDSYIKVYIMDLPLHYAGKEILFMVLFTLICLPVGIWSLQKQFDQLKTSVV